VAAYAAEVPTAINYQGRLVENGELVNQAGLRLRLRLYASPTASTPVVYEENDEVDVVDGFYTTKLGNNRSGGTAASLAEALNTLGTNAWVGIKFGGDPELEPRERLLSSPFALTVRGMHVDGDGDVGIGTSSPESTLHVAAGIAWEDIPVFERVHGTNGASLVSLILRGRTTAADMEPGLGGGLTFQIAEGPRAVGAAAIVTEREDRDNRSALIFKTKRGDTNVMERVRITSGGRVGIGTNAPAASLHVNGDVLAENKLGIGTSDPESMLHVVAGADFNDTPVFERVHAVNTNALASLVLRGRTTAGSMESGLGGGLVFQFAEGSRTVGAAAIVSGREDEDDRSALIFKTKRDSTYVEERVRITSGGNVGIGTNAPASRLHVVAGTDFNDVPVFERVHIVNTNALASLVLRGRTTAGSMESGLGGGLSFQLAEGSRTVGAAAIVSGREDEDDRSALIFKTKRDGTHVEERVRITSGGNVGIGTSAPRERLDLANGRIAGVRLPNSDDDAANREYVDTEVAGGPPGYAENGTFSPAPSATGTDAIALGKGNSVAGDYSVVGGGQDNTIQDADEAVIAGGDENTIQNSGHRSVIGGGHNNVVKATRGASIGGGENNMVESGARWSVIAGGTDNTTQGEYAFAAGRQAKANHNGAFVWADSTGGNFTSTAANQFLVRAAGGFGINTNSPQTELDVNGTTRTEVLQITGGADVAEPFEVAAAEDVPPGALVVIDEGNPGQLKLSDCPYDTKVAGVVSGAGGVNPGLTLSQRGVMGGGVNVALTGRVYALADASNGPIEPGDMLTTSGTPGHAMRAADPQRSYGAVIGKAMTPLREGRGLVLVLVSLQ